LPELYISVDIEASGPIPGEFSLLSLGACVVGDPARNFYVELAPLNDNFTEEAMRTCDLSLTGLRDHGTEPRAAMEQLRDWVRQTTNGARAVFVGFNAPFDWSFVNYYFVKFCGADRNPFGHSALDIKAYYMGAYKTSWAETSMRLLPPELHAPDKPLVHNALEDAIQQAEIFERLLVK
jgi:DNA polymerase III epsilon subunit-like protein